MIRNVFLIVLLYVSGIFAQARNVANGATGNVDFGDSNTVLNGVTGNLSFGCWVKIGAGAAVGGAIADNGGPAESGTRNSTFRIRVAGAANSWDLEIGHEAGGTGTDHTHTFVTDMADDTWYYVAVSRNTTAKTYNVWMASAGSALSLVETWTYTSVSDGGSSVTCAFMLFNMQDVAQADDLTLANIVFYTRELTLGEHSSNMTGHVPIPGSLSLWAPLIGSSPEPNWSGNALNGTVTSTTVVGGAPIQPPFK